MHATAPSHRSLARSLERFSGFGTSTRVSELELADCPTVKVYTNEFWTSRQRAAHSLHEVSYRACFKPQLPRFFIERLTKTGACVHDPFAGRGTTVIEAALLGRRAVGADVNPLSRMLGEPRLTPPTREDIETRLGQIPFEASAEAPADLKVFYHRRTLAEIAALRRYLLDREEAGTLDAVDRWIRMVAVNRLTGHSPGFFSVYTLPPNQAVSVASQRRINARRKQKPPRRDVPALIARKSRSLLKDCNDGTRETLARIQARILTADAAHTDGIESGSVDLVVTSPPFLDVVDYAGDNWLRCWFCGVDPSAVEITLLRNLADWEAAMTEVFQELRRVLVPGGFVAFEVGEVRGGTVRLEESVVPCGVRAGLEPVLVLVNAQEFTKTANCWGVTNGRRGTNTNRIVLLRKS